MSRADELIAELVAAKIALKEVEALHHVAWLRAQGIAKDMNDAERRLQQGWSDLEQHVAGMIGEER